MRGHYVQITKIRYLCFDLVHLRYTRMAGFGRREIELMQALCIYNIYKEYYSVPFTLFDTQHSICDIFIFIHFVQSGSKTKNFMISKH